MCFIEFSLDVLEFSTRLPVKEKSNGLAKCITEHIIPTIAGIGDEIVKAAHIA